MDKTKQKNMNNIIAVLAVVVVAVAVINLSITFVKVSDFQEKLTGYALGYVNISISSNIQINLTNSVTNFGAGGVNSTCDKAMLKTNGASTGVVLCGNWSADNGKGIVIENNGNVNATLTAQGANDAASFIGGSGSTYEWNFSVSEAGSCSGGTLSQNVFRTANTSAPATLCTDFSPLDTGDEVTLDINITVPTDALIGARSDTITISASAQG
jgi:hypothetical protein